MPVVAAAFLPSTASLATPLLPSPSSSTATRTPPIRSLTPERAGMVVVGAAAGAAAAAADVDDGSETPTTTSSFVVLLLWPPGEASAPPPSPPPGRFDAGMIYARGCPRSAE